MKRVSDDAESVRIICRDAPDIVMVDSRQYEALIETNYLFSNLAYINEAIEQADRGEFVDVDY